MWGDRPGEILMRDLSPFVQRGSSLSVLSVTDILKIPDFRNQGGTRPHYTEAIQHCAGKRQTPKVLQE